ncbi:hypothetical protein [Desmospora profundinema]|uniref:Uncharacterized protein n=1 Tax=Desmospora profundinema TaxID=1571184 RepID=A0ABU1IJM0_9BACL|nr:hypothetical protein [Desmospora profundinema]MDR6224974.1 hypothetical protein [Desmospora profundinema]
MKTLTVIAVSALLVLIAAVEWSTVSALSKKEKVVFLLVMGIGWMLSVSFLLFPGMPGPTWWIEAVFGSLGHLLE